MVVFPSMKSAFVENLDLGSAYICFEARERMRQFILTTVFHIYKQLHGCLAAYLFVAM